MEIEKGQRVVAATDITACCFNTIREGTEGVVVELPGIASDTYQVDWENQETTECREDDLLPL